MSKKFEIGDKVWVVNPREELYRKQVIITRKSDKGGGNVYCASYNGQTKYNDRPIVYYNYEISFNKYDLYTSIFYRKTCLIITRCGKKFIVHGISEHLRAIDYENLHTIYYKDFDSSGTFKGDSDYDIMQVFQLEETKLKEDENEKYLSKKLLWERVNDPKGEIKNQLRNLNKDFKNLGKRILELEEELKEI